MGVLVIIILIAAVAGWISYGKWLAKGIQPRTFTTSMSQDAIRGLFESRVAKTGWKIVDDGNPMVAQSSLMAGIRQQISLSTKAGDNGTLVRVGPQRWVTSWGVPKKAHTIRLRLNSFVTAVQADDPGIVVEVEPLQGA